MNSIKYLIFFLVIVAVAHAQEDDEGDYDGDAGGAQPAGWGDGFFGGEGGDDEGFAASGQAASGDQAPEVVGGSDAGSGLFGQEAMGGLYGALGAAASNRKPVVKAAPKK